MIGALRFVGCGIGVASDNTSPIGRIGVGVLEGLLNGLGGASVRIGVLGALVRPDIKTINLMHVMVVSYRTQLAYQIIGLANTNTEARLSEVSFTF